MSVRVWVPVVFSVLVVHGCGPSPSVDKAGVPGPSEPALIDAKRLEGLPRLPYKPFTTEAETTTRDQIVRLTKRWLATAEGNATMSPYGLHAIATMLAAGATGDTLLEIRQELLGGFSVEEALEFHRAQRNFYAPLAQGERFLNANGAWIEEKFAVLPAYQDALTRGFRTEIMATKFPQPGESQINAWVEQKTKGLISALVSGLDQDTRFVVANALAFADAWEDPFEPERTQNRDFFVRPDQPTQVRMMRRSGTFAYAESAKAQAVRLPYASGLGMTLILPRPGVELPDVLVDRETAGWLLPQGLESRPGEVLLPKWSARSRWDLEPIVSKWGVRRMFDLEQSEFAGVSKTPVVVGQMVQEAVIRVDESGTVAVAASLAEGAAKAASSEPPQPFTFLAERPFFYAITDSRGVILFAGLVRDPKKL